MANYIHSDILSEAYSHLNVEIAENPAALAKLKNEMHAFFLQRAQFLFGDDVTVQIEFEQGSLITRLTVLGSAALVVASAVAQYGSFRESVGYLVKDAGLLAQSANLEMVFRTKAAYCDRVRVEKRKGVFGRADELLNELDVIKNSVRDSSIPRSSKAVLSYNKDTTEKLIEWDRKVLKLFDKFEHDETKACIAAGFLEELEQTPAVAPWAKDINNASFRSTIATSDPEQAGLVAAAATRYSETVKSMRKSYADMVKQYTPKSA